MAVYCEECNVNGRGCPYHGTAKAVAVLGRAIGWAREHGDDQAVYWLSDLLDTYNEDEDEDEEMDPEDWILARIRG